MQSAADGKAVQKPVQGDCSARNGNMSFSRAICNMTRLKKIYQTEALGSIQNRGLYLHGLIYNSITTSDEKHTYMINYAHANLPLSSIHFIKSFQQK